MNIVLISEDECEESQVILHGRRFRHIQDVVQAQVGDELKVGVLNGKIGYGRVDQMTDNQAVLSLTLKEDPQPPLDVKLILALPRPPMIRRILQAVTSLGVKDICFLNTARVEKSFWQSSALREEDVRKQLILGLEQGVDTVLPKVILKNRFKPFVEDELPEWIKGRNAFVGHPIAEALDFHSMQTPAVLIIGPEGGFLEYELNMFYQMGVTPVSMGPRILRVETAVSVLLGALM